MSSLQDLRSLVALARKFGQEPSAELLEQIRILEIDETQRLQREAKIRARVAEDLTELFNLRGEVHELVQSPPEQTSDTPSTVTESVIEPTTSGISEAEPDKPIPVAEPTIAEKVAKVITEQGVVAPEPVLAKPPKNLELEIKYLREWVSRIAATGPGGGAGDIINLDAPVIVVTTSSYTISRRDYYVGVNVGTSTTIVLPGSNTKAGRSLIIKDESGRCSVNPITISGTIDNDTSGAILAIDNGALHLIYRQGWRIV